MSSGGGPEPLGCKKANISTATYDLIEKIGMDEVAHVAFLREVLGAKAVPSPLIDLSQFATAVAAAYNLATNGTLSPAFDYAANSYTFVLSSFTLEDVGVTAYLVSSLYPDIVSHGD